MHYYIRIKFGIVIANSYYLDLNGGLTVMDIRTWMSNRMLQIVIRFNYLLLPSTQYHDIKILFVTGAPFVVSVQDTYHAMEDNAQREELPCVY